jgi:hypothetical protein
MPTGLLLAIPPRTYPSSLTTATGGFSTAVTMNTARTSYFGVGTSMPRKTHNLLISPLMAAKLSLPLFG